MLWESSRCFGRAVIQAFQLNRPQTQKLSQPWCLALVIYFGNERITHCLVRKFAGFVAARAAVCAPGVLQERGRGRGTGSG